MSRPVRSQTTCDGDVDAVFRLLTDERWVQRKRDALHDDSRVVRREQLPDGGVTLVVSRALPDGVPGFLERFLPADGRVTQIDQWGPAEGGTRRGRWAVELAGAPATLAGTLLVEPAPGGSRYVVAGAVTVKVPVIGGRAEGFLAGMVEKLAAKEGALLRSCLPPSG